MNEKLRVSESRTLSGQFPPGARFGLRSSLRRGPSMSGSRPRTKRPGTRAGGEYAPGTHSASILLRKGMEFEGVVRQLQREIGLDQGQATRAAIAAAAELGS